jgi:hypothetical protein
MSDLEAAVQSFIVPALNGSGTLDLSQSQCLQVARWATKIALLLELSLTWTNRGGYVPPDHLSWLHDHRSPPPDTQVWLGAVDAENHLIFWSATSRWGFSRDAPKGYVATFTIGYVLFQVFGRDLPGTEPDLPRSPMKQPSTLEEFLLPVWPGVSAFHWPPTVGFHWEDLDRIWPTADPP